MKRLLDYRILLIVWLAVGISFTGYFYINPTKRTSNYRPFRHSDEMLKFIDISYKNVQISGLVTLVGAILIGGIGYVLSKKS